MKASSYKYWPIIPGIKCHWFQWGCGIWLTAINISHEVLFDKVSGKPPYSFLPNHGAVAKPLGHFPMVLKLLIETFLQPYAALLLHLLLGWHGWNWWRGGCNEPGMQTQDGSVSTAPLILLPHQDCLMHSLYQRQLNIMPNALSLAFSCRKWPLYVVLSPDLSSKLIMTQTGAAQPASELDSFSGSYSEPNMPGNSAQVLTVASEGTACLD